VNPHELRERGRRIGRNWVAQLHMHLHG
jgi:hypothetical protein